MTRFRIVHPQQLHYNETAQQSSGGMKTTKMIGWTWQLQEVWHPRSLLVGFNGQRVPELPALGVGRGAHLIGDIKRGKIRQIFGRHVFHQFFVGYVYNYETASQKQTPRGENWRGVQYEAVQYKIQQTCGNPF